MSKLKKLAMLAVGLSFLSQLCPAADAATRTRLSPTVQDEPVREVARPDSSVLVRRLTSRDPLARQHAAEELAHLAAVEQRRLVEGYRMQEKNGRVRVALDWALYRMGKREALYSLVAALDSSQTDQAQVYLSALESPDALYLFLERTNGKTQAKLLQVLGYIGNAETLERIKPFTQSPDPKLAEAARAATDDITQRLASSSSAAPNTSQP